jgi:hypothetical protein
LTDLLPIRALKTYPPLLIDTDRILPGPVALQSLKAVAWKTGEYLQSLPALPIKSLKRSDELALREELGAPVLEAKDHSGTIAA